jgi:hypothetical protein
VTLALCLLPPTAAFASKRCRRAPLPTRETKAKVRVVRGGVACYGLHWSPAAHPGCLHGHRQPPLGWALPLRAPGREHLLAGPPSLAMLDRARS